jgi:hypothetical protein
MQHTIHNWCSISSICHVIESCFQKAQAGSDLHKDLKRLHQSRAVQLVQETPTIQSRPFVVRRLINQITGACAVARAQYWLAVTRPRDIVSLVVRDMIRRI